MLEEQSGRPRFVGQPEGGLRDTGAGYFLLMKGKGNEFLAVPVSDVFTFKPALQRRHQRCAVLPGCGVAGGGGSAGLAGGGDGLRLGIPSAPA